MCTFEQPNCCKINKVWNKFPVLTLTHIFSNAHFLHHIIYLFFMMFMSCGVMSSKLKHLQIYTNHPFGCLKVFWRERRLLRMMTPTTLLMFLISSKGRFFHTLAMCNESYMGNDTYVNWTWWWGSQDAYVLNHKKSHLSQCWCLFCSSKFLLFFCSMFCSSFTNFKQVMKPRQTPLNKTSSKAQVEKK